MEIKDASKYAGWYASYMSDKQGVALVECLLKKVEQQKELLQNIVGEIELAEEPKEIDSNIILQSVKKMVEQENEVSVERGYFKWFIK